MSHALDVTIPQDEGPADDESPVVTQERQYLYGRKRRMSPSAPDVGPAQRAVMERLYSMRDESGATVALLGEVRNVSPTRYSSSRHGRTPTVSPSVSLGKRGHSRCCQQNREEAARAREQFHTLQRELLSLQADVKKVREEKELIQAEIAAAKRAPSEPLQLPAPPADPQVKKLKSQLDEYRATIKQLHDNVAAHTQSIKNLKQEGLHDKETIASLKRELQEKDDELEKCERERLGDKNTITQLQEEVVADQDTLSELREELVD
eukprot:TRINITY_DN4117_c0_g1_i4.p1 TRINITY_DN4117_c0_g1~~TRINITY_DN4117_c0_g1_i4.p1  ORF type:complete len:275 (+),score=121.04 TRINITY_DN4117_c0_g1_i4:36-827(+)